MDSKEDREENSGFLGALIVASPILLTVALLASAFAIHFCLQVSDEQQVKHTAMLLSSTQSSIEVQPTIVSLSLPAESFVYDANGGAVAGDSLVSFNTGSNELSFRVSYSKGNERKSFEVKLSGSRDGVKYQLTHDTEDDTIVSVRVLISGLDTSLNWYLDRKRVMPSSDGTLEVWLPKPDNVIYSSPNIVLVGYSGVDNSLQDGIILSYSDK